MTKSIFDITIEVMIEIFLKKYILDYKILN